MGDIPLASNLLGKQIDKWRVIEKRDKNVDDNSGNFSSCYKVVDKDENIAFLKAFNYCYAFGSNPSADILKNITENFTYERDLLVFCSENKMQRIVTAIDSGEYREDGEVISVPYLVFEIAQGSLKSRKIVENPDLAWKLTAFHGALIGLHQLHRAKIAHQDIKPSNILIFGNNYSKISDLGRATQFNNPSNCDDLVCAGDMRYAPVELLYNYISPDWDTRRYGADFFMMGGILCFMLTDSNFLGLMHSKLPDNKKHNNFGGDFEEVKPYLMKAYSETLEEIKGVLPKDLSNELISVLSELSHPIPEERGNPQNIMTVHRQFSLEKYISKVNRLAKYAMWNRI